MAGAQDWSNALWDETAVYDLTVEIVNQFLRETFGNWDFFTKQPNDDTIQFWVPRKLTQHERDDLKARGYRVVAASGYGRWHDQAPGTGHQNIYNNS